MGWLKKLIPGSKKEEVKGIGALLPMPAYGRVNPDLLFSTNGNHYGVDWTAQLAQNVMQKIFEYVCPHTMDESYEPHEGSAGVGCVLCHLRDLSYCVLVCKRWRKFAVPVLYRSIRIDSVHYCPLEAKLEERRTRKGLKEGTACLERMSLLSRTVKDDPQIGLGDCILLLKLPYMVCLGCRPDLARIASVAPNLRYIDLPHGFFSGDASCQPLREELEKRCPDIRKMTYNAGTEKRFAKLTTGELWPNLEVLSLNGLSVDPDTLRYVFWALQNLQELSVENMPMFSDLLIAPTDGDIPPFPPVTSLSIVGCPGITKKGLLSYLEHQITSDTLQSLSLAKTSVQPQDIHALLSAGTALQHFSIEQQISSPFPSKDVPLLKHRWLHTLHFEITAQVSAAYTSGTTAHHEYLLSSLLGNNLPNLRELYVRDTDFPTKLGETGGGNGLGGDLAPPMPGFMGDALQPRPFAGRGTAANRDSTASNFSFGPSSPPSKSGGFQPMSSSPENTRTRAASGGRGGNRDSFGPESLSPPKPGFKNMSMHERRQSHLSMHQAQNAHRTAGGTKRQEGLKSPLTVFTRVDEQQPWSFSDVQPAQGHHRGASVSRARPISMIGVEDGGGAGAQSWIFGEELPAPPKMGQRGYRSSVIMDNGFGGVIQREIEPGMEGSKTGNKLGKKNVKADLF